MKSKMHAGAIKLLYQRARELRNNSTHTEQILWGYLKTKPLGFKFRRQHPYSIYILDFYCHTLKLVIEVDGSIHSLADVKEIDIKREEMLEKDGLTVLRFENSGLKNYPEVVFNKIEVLLRKRKNETETL